MLRFTQTLVMVALIGPLMAWSSRADAQDAATLSPSKSAPMSITEVGRMLRQMGFTVQPKWNRGKMYYSCKVHRDGWKYVFRVSLNSSGRTVFFSAGLGSLRQGLSAEKLKSLLHQNGFRTGKGYFAVDSSDYMEFVFPIDNRGISPRWLRSDMDIFFKHVKLTSTVWKSARRPSHASLHASQ